MLTIFNVKYSGYKRKSRTPVGSKINMGINHSDQGVIVVVIVILIVLLLLALTCV